MNGPRKFQQMKIWHFSVALILLLCVSCVHVSSTSPLAWKVIDVRPHQNYWVVDHIDPNCWCVDIEVTNQTTRGVAFDWNRDETAFQADGRWDSLHIGGLMNYLGPGESWTFPLYLPERAEAYRYLMYYKLGSSTYDRQFLIEAKLPRYGAAEKPTPDATVVKVLETPLPRAEDVRSEFLWDNFANKPDEQKFSSYTTDHWKDNYVAFAKVLVQKAYDQKLDSESLSRALALLGSDSLPQLPVGVYQMTLEGELVWIVTVKWEFWPKGKPSELSHIRIFAFDQKTLKQVGFVTCR